MVRERRYVTDLLALRTFQAVVEEGGVLAASRKLATVQSNVTSRIQRLEDELGTPLFVRTGRGLALAPPGRVLLDYARRLLLLERRAAAAIRQVGENAGELRLGSIDTFALLYLPAALLAVRDGHPGLGVRVETGTASALVGKVLAHHLDAALTSGPIDHAELEFEELVVEELVQVTARGSDPARLPAILFRDGCAYRTRALAWQRAIGHATADLMELGTLDGILGCVSAGLGWTLLPRRVVVRSAFAARLVASRIAPALGRVPTGLVRLRAGAAWPALETLATSVRAAGRETGRASSPRRPRRASRPRAGGP